MRAVTGARAKLDVFLQQLVNGITIGAIYSLMAVGLTIILGIADIPNFAHGQLYMLGAFVSFYAVSAGMNFFLAIILGMVAVAVLGILVEKGCFRPVRRMPHTTLLVIAAGVAYTIENLALAFWGPYKKSIITPFTNVSFNILDVVYLTAPRLIALVSAVILLWAAYWFIRRTSTGKQMRAVAEDHEASSLVGINLDNIYSITFALGCGLAAISGALVGGVFPIVATMGLMPTLKAFCVVVMAGRGNIIGAIYMGLLLGLVEIFGTAYIFTGIRDLFAFALLIIVLLVRKRLELRRR